MGSTGIWVSLCVVEGLEQENSVSSIRVALPSSTCMCLVLQNDKDKPSSSCLSY